jgi:hypothetical protein
VVEPFDFSVSAVVAFDLSVSAVVAFDLSVSVVLPFDFVVLMLGGAIGGTNERAGSPSRRPSA